MKKTQFKHQFVELIPKQLEEATLYISIPYGTITHKCACGCGSEVVTPLNRNGWAVTYDGESISLYPSIGNWNLPCKSHYWIRESRIEWSTPWREHHTYKGDEESLWQKFLNFLK